MARVTDRAFGANSQIVRDVIEACGMQFHRPRRGGVGGLRSSTLRAFTVA
jgi:hypothetical protein